MKPEREHNAMKTKKTETNPKGAGRLTDYDPVIFFKKLEEYKKERQDHVDALAKIHKVRLPTIDGLAVFIKVTRPTLYNWGEKYPEVKQALDEIMQEQLQRLIDEGLGGNYNPTIVKLLLSHNHGIREETIQEVKSEVTNKFDDRQIARIAERIASRGRSNGNSSSKEESN